MSQPSTQSLRERAERILRKLGCIRNDNNEPFSGDVNWLVAELEALLPSLDVAISEGQPQRCLNCGSVWGSGEHIQKQKNANKPGIPRSEQCENQIYPQPSATELGNLKTARAVAQARVDEAKWWQDYKDTNSDYKSAPMDPGPQRIADLERDLAAIAKETK